MKNVTEKEVRNIKMLADRNISCSEICDITGRSKSTVKRALRGDYDHKESSTCCSSDIRELIEKNLEVLAEIEDRL